MFAEVYRIDQACFSIELHDAEAVCFPYRLYVNTMPEKTKKDEDYLMTGTTSYETFFYQEALKRPCYFTLVFADGSDVLCGFRIVPLSGMYNVRDLGGYPTKDGKAVRWGCLYRGDHLFNLNEDGLPYLKQMKLQSIIDFRKEEEWTHYPNGQAVLSAKEYHFAPDGQIAAFAGSLQNNEGFDSHKDQITYAREMVKKDSEFASKAMIRQQIEFVQKQASQEAYCNTLSIMAQADAAPIFFHCKGGKDRTGFAAMLLLGLLDVEEDIIIYDYLLTNRAREKKNQRYLENFRTMAQGDEEVAQYLYSIFDTRKEYLIAAINEIKEKSGSIRQYAIDVLHIDEAMIASLKQLYLE